jgi:hypothetical protein
MKLNLTGDIRIALAAALAVLSIGSAVAAGEVLRTGDVTTIGQWYGRAGGLVGSDRVEGITKATAGGERVGITYDKDVAARTNMPRQDAENGNVTITYDKDVAERTNMPRGEQPIKAVGVPAKPAN